MFGYQLRSASAQSLHGLKVLESIRRDANVENDAARCHWRRACPDTPLTVTLRQKAIHHTPRLSSQ